MPPSATPQCCHLLVSLSTTTPAIVTGNLTVCVDHSSDNLASKSAYLLNNNGMYLCPSSATHGKLLTTALCLSLGRTALH